MTDQSEDIHVELFLNLSRRRFFEGSLVYIAGIQNDDIDRAVLLDDICRDC